MRYRKKSWKGFEERKLLGEVERKKTENKGMGEILKKEGSDRLREKNKSEKKRKIKNKERRERFREWGIRERKKENKEQRDERSAEGTLEQMGSF